MTTEIKGKKYYERRSGRWYKVIGELEPEPPHRVFVGKSSSPLRLHIQHFLFHNGDDPGWEVPSMTRQEVAAMMLEFSKPKKQTAYAEASDSSPWVQGKNKEGALYE